MKLADYHALPARDRAYVSVQAQRRAGCFLRSDRTIDQAMLNGISKPKD